MRTPDGRNLTNGLHETLGRSIVGGTFESGFPTEAELSRLYGLSRSVTREASPLAKRLRPVIGSSAIAPISLHVRALPVARGLRTSHATDHRTASFIPQPPHSLSPCPRAPTPRRAHVA